MVIMNRFLLLTVIHLTVLTFVNSTCTVDCSDVVEGNTYPHCEFCQKYVTCSNGRATVVYCMDDLVYDVNIGACHYPNVSTCGANYECALNCNGMPDQMYPHCTECSQHILCLSEVSVILDCPQGENFDLVSRKCKDKNKATCGTKQGVVLQITSPTTSPTQPTTSPTSLKTSPTSTTTSPTTSPTSPATSPASPTTSPTSPTTSPTSTTTSPTTPPTSLTTSPTSSTTSPTSPTTSPTSPTTSPTSTTTSPTTPPTSLTTSPTSPTTSPTSPTMSPTSSTMSPTTSPTSPTTSPTSSTSLTTSRISPTTSTISPTTSSSNYVVGKCLQTCEGLKDGNYQCCQSCHFFTSCVNEYMYDKRPCPEDLVWDDAKKNCLRNSTTCFTDTNF
ncbi:hypothetical protein SNE40_016734 [Patella caerulea]|uniref:Chitin-binding type-2 domain-containing protein n=1 Tax=Patella caerulea TaxID=87958 RepID=A0AAN8PCR5_PATCE